MSVLKRVKNVDKGGYPQHLTDVRSQVEDIMDSLMYQKPEQFSQAGYNIKHLSMEALIIIVCWAGQNLNQGTF